jgi:hypothetical protein
MSFLPTSLALWSVAIETVVPAMNTGSRTANGVTAPVRPTFTSIFRSRVSACSGGNLNAIAHRGNLDVVPSLARRAMLSSFTTTPSVSNGSARVAAVRFSDQSRQYAATSSMPFTAFQ